jgi:hypothetical protein
MDDWMEVCEWMAANAWHQGRKQGRKLHPLKRASAQASFILYKASQFLPHFRKEKKLTSSPFSIIMRSAACAQAAMISRPRKGC